MGAGVSTAAEVVHAHDQHVAIGVIDHLSGNRLEHPIEPVVLVVADDDQIDAQCLGGVDDPAPGSAVDHHQRRAERDVRRARHKVLELGLAPLDQLFLEAVRNTVGAGRDLGRDQENPEQMDLGSRPACDGEGGLKHLGLARRLVERDQDGTWTESGQVRTSSSGAAGAATGAGARLAMRRNITGTRKRERIVEEVRPPTTASASG